MFSGIDDAVTSIARLLVFLTVVCVPLSLLPGCITMNKCPYCHENRQPVYIRHETEDLGYGFTRETKWYGWVHYYRRVPQPDKNIELIGNP